MVKLIFLFITIFGLTDKLNDHSCNHLIRDASVKYYKADFVMYAKIKKNHANSEEVYDQKWELEILEVIKGNRVDTFKTTSKRLCHTSWFSEGDFVIIYGENRNESNVAYDTKNLINQIVKYQSIGEEKNRKYYKIQSEERGKIELEALRHMKEHFDLTNFKKYIPSIKIDSHYPSKTIKKKSKDTGKIKFEYYPKGSIHGNNPNEFFDIKKQKPVYVRLEFEEYNKLKNIHILNEISKKNIKLVYEFFSKGIWELKNPENLERIILIETLYILEEDIKIPLDF